MDTQEKATILIVDDKEANIFALETLLEKPGRSFLKATSGTEGLKIALNEEVDLIILDVQMPDLDGFEVAQTLKSHKRTRDIPIIFASAEKKERQSVMKGFEEGAVDYLPKPLDPEVTRAKVSVLLRIQQQKKELMEKNQSLLAAQETIRTLNAHLQQNIEKVEAANKELEAFSYSISHDLRAPLRSIIGYSKELEADHADVLNEDGKFVLSVIQKNAVRMNTLIDDLLEFSRMGRTALNTGDVNMNELVQAVVKELSSKTSTANIQIGDLPPSVGDASLLRQVWTNLISNAIKYSAKRERPEIQIGSRQESRENVYFVKDNGAGFDIKYADKLFGVFQRLHRMEDFEGTGVGLALVKRIVTRHGGRVWAEAEVNKGATFYFALPG